jgi:hypothetical protein
MRAFIFSKAIRAVNRNTTIAAAVPQLSVGRPFVSRRQAPKTTGDSSEIDRAITALALAMFDKRAGRHDLHLDACYLNPELATDSSEGIDAALRVVNNLTRITGSKISANNVELHKKIRYDLQYYNTGFSQQDVAMVHAVKDSVDYSNTGSEDIKIGDTYLMVDGVLHSSIACYRSAHELERSFVVRFLRMMDLYIESGFNCNDIKSMTAYFNLPALAAAKLFMLPAGGKHDGMKYDFIVEWLKGLGCNKNKVCNDLKQLRCFVSAIDVGVIGDLHMLAAIQEAIYALQKNILIAPQKEQLKSVQQDLTSMYALSEYSRSVVQP